MKNVKLFLKTVIKKDSNLVIHIFLCWYFLFHTFVGFAQRSSFGPDISRAIARPREDGKLDLIEQTWFQDHSVFKKQESPAKLSILNSYSFRGLFLVTGISSTLALVIFYVLLIKSKVTSCREFEPFNGLKSSIWL